MTRGYMSRLVLAGTALLLLAACDKFNIPAPPAQGGSDTLASATPPAAPKPKPVSRRSAEVDPETVARRFDVIQRELRRLVVAEETYYAENGIYTDDPTRLGFRPADGNDVRFLWVTRTGWAASAAHPDVPGRNCIVFVGRARAAPKTMRDHRAGREGAPVCDAPPRRRSPSAHVATPSLAAEDRPGSGTADTGSALDAVDPGIQMRVDLRNLVRSQESYYANQGIYSRRTEPFALQYLWHKGVTISILSANDAAWSARATHVSRPGKSCVIWLGPVAQRPATDAEKRSSEQPGIPVCDD
jgi:hypothetical protein